MNPVNNIHKVNPHMETIQRRINVAKALAEGKCGGNYYDACILISSTISGLAADIWPGHGIDKRRFVEVWVRFADPSLIPNPLLISIPILIAYLAENGANAEVEIINNRYPDIYAEYCGGRVVTSADIDMAEDDLIGICPGLESKILRQYSYPMVFYNYVRSSLIHEYRLGELATGYSHIDDDNNNHIGIDYTNSVDLTTRRQWREIHFRIPWLLDVVHSISSKILSLTNAPDSPRLWWLDGGKA
jgi:hypothetical protein